MNRIFLGILLCCTGGSLYGSGQLKALRNAIMESDLTFIEQRLQVVALSHPLREQLLDLAQTVIDHRQQELNGHYQNPRHLEADISFLKKAYYQLFNYLGYGASCAIPFITGMWWTLRTKTTGREKFFNVTKGFLAGCLPALMGYLFFSLRIKHADQTYIDEAIQTQTNRLEHSYRKALMVKQLLYQNRTHPNL